MKLDPQKSLEAMHATGPVLAQARADRVYAEEWRAVADWPEYAVSNLGRVKRVAASCGTREGKILNPTIMKNGYLKVGLSRYPTRKEMFVHRLVAEAFIDPIPKGMDVCHNDGDKTNNRHENLRIDTRRGNMADQVRFGKTPRGEKSGSNKYTRERILSIRSMAAGGDTPSSIARFYGMPKPTVYGIVARTTWFWL